MAIRGKGADPRPDQGFSWVIAASCFFINFIMAGLARSAAMFYVALIDLYGVSREVATTPFSIRVCVRNLSGPIIGFIGQIIGIRACTITGGIMATIGGCLCYIAPDVSWITVFWGGIHGLGFGFSTVLHMMTINYYFDKYRATALGIGYSGDCIGTVILPILIDYLLDNYGISGTFLILSGVVLHVVPLGMLLKPPPWMDLCVESADEKTFRMSHGSFTEEPVLITCHTKASEPPTELSVISVSLDLNDKHKSSVILHNNDTKLLEDIPTYEEATRMTQDDDHAPEKTVVIDSQITDITKLSQLEEESTSKDSDCNKVLILNEESKPKHCDNVRQIVVESIRYMDHKNSMTATITEHIDNGCETVIKIRALSENRPEISKSILEKLPSIEKNETSIEVSKEYKDGPNDHPVAATIKVSAVENSRSVKRKADVPNRNSLSDMLKVALKVNAQPIFFLISLTMAIYAFLFVCVITVIIDFAFDRGIDKDSGKYLVTAFSATDLVGRLCLGIVIDKQWISMTYYVVLFVGLMGISVAVIPFSGTSFVLLTAIMSFYGFVQGGCAIVYPILIDKYLTKEEGAIAMGSLGFYGGLLMLALAPMIGYFRDNIGSYDGMFYIVGLLTFSVAAMWLFEPCIVKCQKEAP